MWTPEEAERALRGERSAIHREWRAEAQARLWHLDKALFGRVGVASQTALATLNALVELHHDRREPRVSSDNTDPPLNDLAARALACSQLWTATSISGADVLNLVALLGDLVRRRMAGRGADADTLSLEDGLIAAISAAIAETRMRELEQQLASLHEEGVLSQVVAGRFLANASHEIRTPMTAVLGFAELLLEETYGSLTDGQRMAIGHIENSAENLLEIVNNLLDLMHIRAGKLTLQYRPVDIGVLLNHVYAILLPLATRKNVLFRIELETEPGIIQADENIVRHLVYHLLASGLRATPSGGDVTLSAVREGDTMVILSRDTAVHLPPDAVANMRDPFPRLENSPARGYEGWEVGLPLVRRYVELHGGTMELETLPDQGTLFRVRLPVNRSDHDVSDDGEMIKTGRPSA